ncbi:MAG: helix-turn-helix domain-containing protein [Actinomycetota bacterium]|nr:helix-turn-helix domain-containing protein [Actinomycetota bacterium]
MSTTSPKALGTPFSLVALRDSLSNLPAPLLRLMEALGNSEVATEETAESRGIEDDRIARDVQENRILSASEVEELVVAYAQGSSLNELARRFGVHRNTVDRHLAKAGASKRPLIKMGPEVLREAVEFYGQGLSVAKVGRKLGLSASTVYSTFVREGIKMRPRNGGRPSSSH